LAAGLCPEPLEELKRELSRPHSRIRIRKGRGSGKRIEGKEGKKWEKEQWRNRGSVRLASHIIFIPWLKEPCYGNKKHLKNVGPIRYCEPPHAHSPGIACASMSTTMPDNDNDNA